jgi:hypothetical protein
VRRQAPQQKEKQAVPLERVPKATRIGSSGHLQLLRRGEAPRQKGKLALLPERVRGVSQSARALCLVRLEESRGEAQGGALSDQRAEQRWPRTCLEDQFCSERSSLIKRVLIVFLLCALIGCSQPSSEALPQLGIVAKETTASGLSAGAYMAGQLQVAHSGEMIGAALVAGGPYGCAETGSGVLPAVARNVTRALEGCNG